MNPKTIALTITTLFLVLILYLLGLRIKVTVGEIQNIQEEDENNTQITPSPTISEEDNIVKSAPAPSYYGMLEQEKVNEEGYLGPYGYISKNNVSRREEFPHHNPLMYQEREKILLNNIPE